MDVQLWGLTIEFLGNALLAVSILMVHRKIESEHRIDRAVLRTMKREEIVALMGLVFMLVGYLLQVGAL